MSEQKVKLEDMDLAKVSGGSSGEASNRPLCPHCGNALETCSYSDRKTGNRKVWTCDYCTRMWDSFWASPPENDGFGVFMWEMDYFTQ